MQVWQVQVRAGRVLLGGRGTGTRSLGVGQGGVQSASCSKRGHCPHLPSSRTLDVGHSIREPQVEAEREAASLGLGGNFRRAKSTLGAARTCSSMSVSALQGEAAY